MKMKKVFLKIFMLLIIAATGSSFAQQMESIIPLYNGSNLSNWNFYLQPTDNAVEPAEVFHPEAGSIVITGVPFGYMRSKAEYSNYQLHLEWRWPVTPTNSGVFIHAQPGDTIWPACFECQLKAGNAGDIVFMGNTSAAEKEGTTRVKSKFQESNEKPVGQWNTLIVTCRGNTIEIEVNGVLQNRITNTSVAKGNICLQSEGGTIEFRNITVTQL